MGGSTTQQTQQQSQTQPWAPAQPLLQGILGQLSGNLPNTGITGAQTNALNAIEGNANNFGGYAPAINSVEGALFAGGGALNQSPAIKSAYNQYVKNTSPLANNTDYNPYNTPGFGNALSTLNNDISNQINGQFAAAGRDMSPANSQSLARGLSQGEGQLIANQYNQNVQNQQNAANSLYGAGNTTSGILSGLTQQQLSNQVAGLNGVGTALQASNAGNAATLAAEGSRFGIPVQNLGLLSNIGIPIAGLGNQASGTSNTSQSAPWYSQLAGAANGIGSLLSFL